MDSQLKLVNINDNRRLIEKSFPGREPSPRLMQLHPSIIKAALEENFAFKPDGTVLDSLHSFFDDFTKEELLEDDSIELCLDALKLACRIGLDEDYQQEKPQTGSQRL